MNSKERQGVSRVNYLAILPNLVIIRYAEKKMDKKD